jgi:hypothetical protein
MDPGFLKRWIRTVPDPILQKRTSLCMYLAEFLADVGLQGQILLTLRNELLLQVLHQIQQDVILQLLVTS